jgi:uncharacterized RDD family membrane protein YckC
MLLWAESVPGSLPNTPGVALMTDQANPYAPPKAVVRDAEIDSESAMASRGSRLGAALLDGLIAFLAGIPILIALGSNLAAIGASGATDTTAITMAILQNARGGLAVSGLLWLGLIAVTIVLVHRNAQTLGKKMVGIKVVRSDGSRATLGRIFWLRNVVNLLPSLIPIVGNLYGLIDSLFIFSDKRQCLHDKIADTIVIRA